MLNAALPRRNLFTLFFLITGISLLAWADGAVNVYPTTLNFGTLTVGDFSPYQIVYIENTGDVDVILSSIVVGGKNGIDFNFLPFLGPLPATIHPGQNYIVPVYFHPNGYGQRTGEIQFWTGVSGIYQTVQLTGNGRANFTNFGLRVRLTPGEAVELNTKSTSPCTVEAGFHDAQGNVLVSKTLNLDGQGIQTVRYDAALLPAVRPGTVQARPFVTPVPSVTGAPADCSLFASAEVLDSLTNSTLLFIPGEHPPNPNDAYSVLLPASISLFQNLRLNVIGEDGLCTGTLAFSDAAGNPLGIPKTVSLSAGQSDSLEISARTPSARIGGHSVIQAQFSPSPAALSAAGTCTVYEEVTDAFTGRTMAVFTPTGVSRP